MKSMHRGHFGRAGRKRLLAERVVLAPLFSAVLLLFPQRAAAADLAANTPDAASFSIRRRHAAEPSAPPPATKTVVAPVISSEYGADGLRINFHGAPLKLVLDYLSEAGGFIINKQVEIHGSVEMWSKQPITRNEAVDLLGSVLKKNGYALTRNGRVLTIIAADDVKTADTDIVVGSDPAAVEKSDLVQTQVIPVRYVTAAQLVRNLQGLLPGSATLSANESANTLILVAARTDIKRMLTIVDALDHSLTAASTIKVRPLRYADAKDTANLLTQLFSQQSSSQNSQGATANSNVGGEPGGGPFGGGPPGMVQNGGTSDSSGRGSPAGRVVAVADDRSNSLVLSASPDLLQSIEGMLEQLDRQFSDQTELRVFRLANAEPSELVDQLAQLFPDQSSSGNNQNSDVPFFFPGGGPPRAGSAASTGGNAPSDHKRQSGKVLAVADPRTSALMVTASKTLMPQIAEMIATLDANEGRREIVSYFELKNADPQDIYQNLQDLFNRSTARAQTDNQNSFLGRNNPLTQRATQNQQATASSSTGSMGLGNQSGAGSGARP